MRQVIVQILIGVGRRENSLKSNEKTLVQNIVFASGVGAKIGMRETWTHFKMVLGGGNKKKLKTVFITYNFGFRMSKCFFDRHIS